MKVLKKKESILAATGRKGSKPWRYKFETNSSDVLICKRHNSKNGVNAIDKMEIEPGTAGNGYYECVILNPEGNLEITV